MGRGARGRLGAIMGRHLATLRQKVICTVMGSTMSKVYRRRDGGGTPDERHLVIACSSSSRLRSSAAFVSPRFSCTDSCSSSIHRFWTAVESSHTPLYVAAILAKLDQCRQHKLKSTPVHTIHIMQARRHHSTRVRHPFTCALLRAPAGQTITKSLTSIECSASILLSLRRPIEWRHAFSTSAFYHREGGCDTL